MKHFWKLVKTDKKGKKVTVLTNDRKSVDEAELNDAIAVFDVGTLSQADLDRYQEMGITIIQVESE